MKTSKTFIISSTHFNNYNNNNKKKLSWIEISLNFPTGWKDGGTMVGLPAISQESSF